MKFGYSLFGVGPRHFGELARRAEAVGFESIWIPEHLVFPEEMPATYPYAQDGLPPVPTSVPLYDPWTTLAYVAAQTEKLRLGTHVYVLPLRHPLVTARAVTTLDHLSNGRAILGVGVGWLEEEFTAAGQSFRDRGRRTDEILELLTRLWSEEVIEHHGEFYDIPPIRFEPKPRQKPGVPIEVGGASAAALRRAARFGDGWLAIGVEEPDALAEVVTQLRSLRREAGRENDPFEVTFMLPLIDDLDRLRRFADAGVTRLILRPELETGRRPTLEGLLAFLDRAGDRVIARLQK